MKTIRAAMVASLIIAIYTACSDQAPPTKSEAHAKSLRVKVAWEIDHPQTELIRRVTNEFLDACQPLKTQYISDIDHIEYQYRFECGNTSHPYHCEEFGWESGFFLKIQIKEDTTRIPIAVRAWGHTEHVYLGGPGHAGFTITKFPQLCGKQPNNGADTFIAAPGLANIF